MMCAKLLLALALVADSANGMFEIRRSGDHAASSGATGNAAWRFAAVYNITTPGLYSWKLMYKTCKDDRFQWGITNTSEANAHGRMRADTYWADTYFTFGNMEREVLTDSPAGVTENIPATGKHKIFQFVFNTSKSFACAAISAGDDDDAHAGHAHRRSGPHAGHTDADMFVPKLNFAAAGAYVIFSDRNWEADYGGTLHDPTGAMVSMANEVSQGIVNACPVAESESESVKKEDMDTEKYIYAALIFCSGELGVFISVYWASDVEKLRPYQLLGNVFAAGVLTALLMQHMLPECIELLPASKTDKYPLTMCLAVLGFIAFFALETVLHGCENHDEEKPKGVEGEKNAFDCNKLFNSAAMLAGMGVHSVLEGMPVGLAISSTTLTGLFIGMVTHKVFGALAVCNVLATSNMPSWALFILGTIFALTTPIGLILGMVINNSDTNAVNGAITSITGGILLYISMGELFSPMQKPLKDRENIPKWAFAASFVIGTCTMLLVAINSIEYGHQH